MLISDVFVAVTVMVRLAIVNLHVNDRLFCVPSRKSLLINRSDWPLLVICTLQPSEETRVLHFINHERIFRETGC